MIDSVRQKRCRGECGEVKPAGRFTPNPRLKDGLDSWCRDCRNRAGRARSYDVTVSEKLCSGRYGCGEMKPADQFSRNRALKSGLYSQCKACMNEHRSGIDNSISVSHKCCSHCSVVKRAGRFGRNRQSKDGLSSWCTQCTVERRREIDSQLSVEEKRRRWRKRNYGLTSEDYDRLLAEQRGVCVCGDPIEVTGHLHVDHDHDTGEVRGLLCGSCNRTIGMALESPERLIKLAAYLGLSQMEIMTLGLVVGRRRDAK